jgi:hypothetical protein
MFIYRSMIFVWMSILSIYIYLYIYIRINIHQSCRILLLDEATSALDTETERSIVATLEKLAKQMKMLVRIYICISIDIHVSIQHIYEEASQATYIYIYIDKSIDRLIAIFIDLSDSSISFQ